MGANIIQLDRWDQLQGVIEQLTSLNAGGLPILFRGQGCANWSIRSSLERYAPDVTTLAEYYRLILRVRAEIETLSKTNWQAPTFVELDQKCRQYEPLGLEFSFGRLPAVEYAAFLRHHGFPSPLVDWSTSPKVAGFFAFAPAGEQTRSIYALLEAPTAAKVRASDRPTIHRIGHRVKVHERHEQQRSEYTYCVYFHNGEWRFGSYEDVFQRSEVWPPNSTAFLQDLLVKIVLPSSERVRVLGELDDGNLNAFELFGSVDALMQTVAMRELELGLRK